ncbi:hypothetical protein BCR33DRAFT_796725 [Rhizoclosmatium globosum]|uniref:Uncharacterized protein n=1 Tax=Rhizoclosmatium globosum TaxID=329046 RepID=A0A1Y2AM32_9FUNG|nr:hypothetical protein BCR33DRAFT_796725 [Rhizoclosmatium globosum]|eukprot:ORY22995.1 hypothetical protein BCR33DRAFT_796725 [Rhizoclosmatium globosum]
MGFALTNRQQETLDKLCRFLSSVRGTDKVLMLYQYVAKILIVKLLARQKLGPCCETQELGGPRWRHSYPLAILRPDSPLPMDYLLWLRNPPSTPFLRLIYRLQNLANLFYYPLEHTYFLAYKGVINLSEETTNKIGIWSCRFWAAYVSQIPC